VGDGDDGGRSETRTGSGEGHQPRETGGAARDWGLLPLLLLPVVVVAVRPVDLFSTDPLALVVAVDRASMSVLVAGRHAVLTKFMTSVTGLGSAAAAAAFLGVCHLADWDRELRLAGVSLVITGVVVASLMALVQRPFPPAPVCVTNGPGLSPHSFPSGHAAAVTVFAGVARESEELPFRSVAVIAGIVALSRVYLGTHFLSDTLVGVAIGIGAVAVGQRFLRDRPDGWTPLP
jgi:undecaprenyl-diphosphatase